MRFLTIAALLIGVLFLAACGQAGPMPIPPAPTALPTAGAAAVITAVPTPIVIPPTEFPKEPTKPLPPPTIAPIPTSTPEGGAPEGFEGILTAADFGDDRNPLTGELVEDPANLQRRPIAVKLSNAPASYTRPQSGLNDADLVYEHTTEGNLTRFTAIFYGKTPPRIGPIRSARLIDLELPAMYSAALAYSGSSKGVTDRLREVDFRPRLLYATNKGFYRIEDASKPVEHTLYANPELLWEVLTEKEQNPPPGFSSTNVFSDEPPVGGTPANNANINYNWTVVDWHYDGIKERYLRWTDGIIHSDGNSMEQVSAANVIVISPFHAFDGNICEQTNVDGSCAAWSVEVQLWGSGNATIFRDGQRYDVIWHRNNRTDSLTFTDRNGEPFPLKIGNSWVQVVPSWLDNPLQVNN